MAMLEYKLVKHYKIESLSILPKIL